MQPSDLGDVGEVSEVELVVELDGGGQERVGHHLVQLDGGRSHLQSSSKYQLEQRALTSRYRSFRLLAS
jgi:hypothetical protein